jgi:predicted acyl esterase
VRGTGRSGGAFGVWHDSVNDAYDTLDWIANQTWTNGEVFVTGVSADGIDAAMSISNPHPSLRAQVLIFVTAQAWETFYPGGAYRDALIDGWLESTVRSQAGAIIPFVHKQENPALPWWTPVNGTLWYGNVKWPTIHWAGWYDIFEEFVGAPRARCAPALPHTRP